MVWRLPAALLLLALALTQHPLVSPLLSRFVAMSAKTHRQLGQPQWIMLGDSITQQAWFPDGGTGAALQDLYQRKLDIVPRGYSGYNTDWILQLAEKILPFKGEGADVKLLSIMLGANDAVGPGQHQEVELHRFKDNLRRLVILLHDPSSSFHSPETEILFIGCPPVAHQRPPRTRDRTRTYSYASRDVVDALRTEGDRHVRFVDLHDPMLAAAAALDPAGETERGLEKLLSDGLHLTGDGYRVVTQQIMAIVEAELPHLTPERLPRFAPDWSAMQKVVEEAKLVVQAGQEV